MDMLAARNALPILRAVKRRFNHLGGCRRDVRDDGLTCGNFRQLSQHALVLPSGNARWRGACVAAMLADKADGWQRGAVPIKIIRQFHTATMSFCLPAWPKHTLFAQCAIF